MLEPTLQEEELKMFEELWREYPRKQGKKKAMTCFKKRLKEHSYEEIKRCVERFKREKKDKDIKYLPHGDSFFSHRYYDYLDKNYNEPEFTIASPKTEKTVAKISGYKEYLEAMKSLPYQEYLQTEHWQHFREQAILFYGAKCRLCNSSDREIDVHHKTYENRGRETFNDIIVVCRDCHELIHKSQTF